MSDSIRLPVGEWLELGQAITDKSNLGPKYFRKYHTEKIAIGVGCIVEADGRFYTSGIYILDDR